MSNSDYIALVAIFVTCFFASITGMWTLSAWMSRQFSSTRALVYDKIEEVLTQLKYHEGHDDKRFAELKNDVWLIRLRQAAKDGMLDKPIQQE